MLAACGRLNFDATDDAALLPLIDEPPRYTSGTRFRAVVYQGTAGTVLHEFFDTELGVHCRVEDDGRCKPTAGGAIMYKDAGCTAPVLVVGGAGGMPACGAPPPIVGVFQAPDVRYYAVGTEFTGGTYSGTPANCVPTLSVEPVLYFEQGAEVPATAFGLFEETIIRGRQRLAYKQWVSDDGASQRVPVFDPTGSLYDTALEQSCSVQEDEPGSARCLPYRAIASTNYAYLDAECTQLAFNAFDPAHRYGVFIDQQLCRRNVRVYELPATTPVMTVGYRRGLDGMCTATGSASPYVLVGAEIPLSSFEHLTLGSEPYDTRLSLNVWETADGIRAVDSAGWWFDAARQTRCNAVVEEMSSTLVCAPQWGEVLDRYWTSAGCTGVPSVGKAMCRPDSTLVYYLGTTTPRTTCDGNKYRLQVSEAPVDTQVWQLDENGTCYESTQRVFTSVREVPGTELPPLVRVRE